MADAFRGLTIRLGADARPLNSAINSISKSAGQAQQQMSRLNKALKFNPANVQAMAKMVDLTGDKAAHSAREARTLSTALKQAAASSKELLKGSRFDNMGGIAKLASQTKDAYAQTQKIRSEYTHVNAELQHIYDACKRVYAEQENITFAEADKHIKSLQKNLAGVGDKAKAAKAEMKSLITKATTREGTGELFGLDRSIGSASRLFGIFNKLRAEQKRLQTDLEASKSIDGYRAIQNALVAAKAELRQTAQEAARLKSELYALGGSGAIASAVADSKRLDAAMEKSVHNAEEMKTALKMLPHSIEAASIKLHSMKDAEDTIRHKLEAVKNVLKQIESNKSFDKVAATTRNAWVEAEKAESKYAKLAEGMLKVKSKAEGLEAELKEATMVSGGKSTADIEKLKADLDKAKIAAERLAEAMNKVEGEMKTANLSKAFAEARAEVTRLEAQLAKLDFQKTFVSKLGGIGQSFRQFGYGLYASVTPAIMMTGRYAINMANEIDSSYRDMRKTVNGTEEQFEHLKDAAIEFSRTHVTSASQILDIEAIGGQLGISANDLEAFAHTVSNLDIATNMDTEDIALDLAKLSNIMHFGQEQFDSFADALVRLGNNEPALESDIMKIATRFAGMASNVDMGTADMLAFATAATATGQKAEAAGSSMQRTISRIGGAVSAGGEKLEQYAKISGMTAEEFARTWKDSENHGPAKAMQAFVEGLHRIKTEGGDVDSTLAGLGVNGVRDKQLLAGLSNTTDVLAESLQMANDAWNGMSTTMKDGAIEQAGDAAREAGRKSEGFSGELAKMKNNAAALAVELGEGAAPFIKDLGAMLKDATTWFKGLEPGMKQFIVGAAGVTAALGPLSVGAGTFMSAISGISGGLKSGQMKLTEWAARLNPVGPQLTKTSKAAVGLSNALMGAGSIIGSGPALAGITAAAIALGYLGSKAAEEQARIDKMRESHERLTTVTAALKASGDRLAKGFDGQIGNLSNLTFEVGEFRQGAIDMADKGIALADAIEGKLGDAFSKANLVQSYSDTIRTLAGHCGGSREKLTELKQAVEKYNELTGNSIGIIDSFSGSINQSTAELEANTKAFQANAIAKAYEGVLADAQAHLAEVNVEIVKNKNAIQSATDELAKHGISVEEAIDAMNKVELDPSLEKTLSYRYGSEGWKDLVGTIQECGGALVELSKDQKEAGDVVNAGMQAYTDATKHAAMMTQEAEKAAAAEKKASTYIGELGEKGDKAFSKIKDQAGFAEQSADQFAEALHGANISADLMGSVGAKAFSGFLAQAQEMSTDVPTQLNMVQAAMMAVNNYRFDPKEITITDNGAITTFEGHIVNLNKMTMDDKEFEVSDDGSLKFCQDQTVMLEGSLKRLDAMRATPTVTLNDKASGQVDAMRGTFQKLQGQSVDVKAGAASVVMDTSNFDKGSADVEKKMESIDGLKATAKVDGDISSAITDFTRISNYSFSPKYVDVYIRQHGSMPSTQATGGINMTPMYAVPAFATGAALNGIVKRATMTNQGLVGEAGTEAIMRMGRQTAVVPLSNRRYVRPFARAVAAEMGGNRKPVQSNVTNISINGINVDSNGKMGTLVRELADYAVQSRRAG